ncbi:hypothetical protein A7A08_01852 [Methyloligella halotolerans]|uniref:Uncharacterized protein n=1 Tax=Methyloligella halotolerans TaxID=1177755 RepID=A0A1E2RXY5_9HYPH|nr:hypothetical protein A7A08_01852 [Methyloligella halotolerans]
MSDRRFDYFNTDEFRQRFTAVHAQIDAGKLKALYHDQIPALLGCSADLWRAYLLAKAEGGLVGIRTLAGDLVAVHAPRDPYSLWRLVPTTQNDPRWQMRPQARRELR